MNPGWIVAIVALVGLLLTLVSVVAVRKLKSDLDASTIAALERNNAAIASERDTLAHRVSILETSESQKQGIIDVLRDNINAKAEITGVTELLAAHRQESNDNAAAIKACLDPDIAGSFADQALGGQRDIKRMVGAKRQGDSNGS